MPKVTESCSPYQLIGNDKIVWRAENPAHRLKVLDSRSSKHNCNSPPTVAWSAAAPARIVTSVSIRAMFATTITVLIPLHILLSLATGVLEWCRERTGDSTKLEYEWKGNGLQPTSVLAPSSAPSSFLFLKLLAPKQTNTPQPPAQSATGPSTRRSTESCSQCAPADRQSKSILTCASYTLCLLLLEKDLIGSTRLLL